MSILNHVPSGGLLAKPTGLKTRCQLSPDEFIEKITAAFFQPRKTSSKTATP